MEKTRTEFIHAFTWALTIICFIYIFAVTFFKTVPEMRDFINYLLGNITGIMITIVTFFYGSSRKQLPTGDVTSTTNITEVTETKIDNPSTEDKTTKP